jgi:hypothetical protein
MKRPHVEMIEMRVGKKDDVDLGKVVNGQCGRGQAFRAECKSGQPDSDAWKKNGISENLYPEKMINTVACPSHAAVIRLSLHAAGFGRAKAGAIGRRLSTLHSCQR